MLLVSFLLFNFLFFKQKTAYEMRISVWSSDVCSSDLVGAADDAAKTRPQPRVKIGQPPRPRKRPHSRREGRERDGEEGLRVDQRMEQIGNASSRERVCQ